MFTTFSGNSRRPRQVNLSGRTSNPLAAVQSSGGAVNAPTGGNVAIAQAQLERRARQQERERLQAAKSLQRIWRGHWSRKCLRAEYETALIKSEEALGTLQPETRRFQDVWQHLRLCVKALRPDARDTGGIGRLLLAGHWACEKADELLTICRQAGGKGQTVVPLRSLVGLLLQYLDSALRFQSQAGQHGFGGAETMLHTHQAFFLLGAIIRLARSIPILGYPKWSVSTSFEPNTTVIELYYRIFGRLNQLGIISTEGDSTQRCESVEFGIITDSVQAVVDSDRLILGLLLVPGGLAERTDFVYKALATELLVSKLSESLLKCCRRVVDLEFFLGIARHSLEDTNFSRQKALAQQKLLANLIFLCNTPDEAASSKGGAPQRGPSSFSTNFSFLAILSRALQDYNSVTSLDDGAAEQLKRLVTNENISSLINSTDWNSTNKQRRDDSSVLADYLLTVLRLLPSQADYVRMWIYLSHADKTNGSSAIRLFWTEVSQSLVFKRSSSKTRDVVELLPDQATPTAGGLNADISSNWRMILLFLELYSFALRAQDDEQLVAGLNADLAGPLPGTSTLTLSEMKTLVTFLKNVSYIIYTERNVAIFDGSDPARGRLADAENDSRTSNGGTGVSSRHNSVRNVSMSQLKGATTGLLRMIYERDSRRKFLPPHHFIMENFESEQFIADVFREQELRAAIEQEDADESDDDDQMEWDTSAPWADEPMPSSHTVQLRRQTERMEAYKRLSRRTAWQRAAPRVEILENIPFLVPFETRVQMFRSEVTLDMHHRRSGILDPDEWRLHQRMLAEGMGVAHRSGGAHSAELERSKIFEGAFDAFYKLGDGLKEPIKIAFIGEEGIDGGGVTKEFLTSIIDEVFSSRHDLFAENDQHEMYPNPSSLDELQLKYSGASAADEAELRRQRRLKLQAYEFVGRIVGKCLYEGILVHIPLARFFIAKWALTGGDGSSRHDSTFRPSINDLWDYDQTIYRSMLQVKNYTGDVRDMGLDFSVTHEIGRGVRRDFELRPGGSKLAVDNTNRLIYIQSITRHYLVDRQREQTKAFLDGLSAIIKPTWLRMFNEAEIRVLLGGESKPIDVENLRRWTVYGGVYQIGDDGQEHPTIKMFWEVMHEMEDSDRRKLLQYATSTPNAPLMGFEYLHPRFSIRDSASDQGRLPTSSTCANLLKLPIYKTKALLKDKIMTAIHSGAGFDLS